MCLACVRINIDTFVSSCPTVVSHGTAKCKWNSFLHHMFLIICRQCQSKLPATGLPALPQQKDYMDEVLQSYILDQTARDWKFYVFSKLVSPLFESYCKTVSTANMEELSRTSQAWLDQHCDLSNLRPGRWFNSYILAAMPKLLCGGGCVCGAH